MVPFSGQLVFRYQRVVLIAIDLFQWTELGDYMYIYYYINKCISIYIYLNTFKIYAYSFKS